MMSQGVSRFAILEDEKSAVSSQELGSPESSQGAAGNPWARFAFPGGRAGKRFMIGKVEFLLDICLKSGVMVKLAEVRTSVHSARLDCLSSDIAELACQSCVTC